MEKKKSEGTVSCASRMLTADFAVKLIGMAVLAFYARHLTKSQLAVVPVYDMLGGMSTLFFGFGIFPTFVKILPSALKKDIAEAKSIIFTGCGIVTTGSVFFAMGIFLYSSEVSAIIFHNQANAEIVQLLSIGVFVSALKTTTDYLLWSASRFKNISFIKILQSLMTVIVTIPLLLFWGVKGLICGLVVRDVVCVGISLSYLKDILFVGTLHFYPARKLLTESLPFYLESYLMYFKSQGDSWIVTMLLGPASMAIYYIAKRLYDMFLTMFNSIDQVATVKLSSLRDDTAGIEQLLAKLISTIAMLIIPFIFLIIGMTPAFITVIAGKGYASAIFPSMLLSFGVLIQFLWAPLGRVVFVLRPPTTRVALSMVEACGLILSLATLVPMLHVVGVALSRIISSFFAATFALYALRGVIRLHVSGRQIFVSIFVSSVMAAFLLWCQALNASLMMLPIYGLGAAVIFFLLTSIFNAPFYGALNAILPFTVVDPIKVCWRIIRY